MFAPSHTEVVCDSLGILGTGMNRALQGGRQSCFAGLDQHVVGVIMGRGEDSILTVMCGGTGSRKPFSRPDVFIRLLVPETSTHRQKSKQLQGGSAYGGQQSTNPVWTQPSGESELPIRDQRSGKSLYGAEKQAYLSRMEERINEKKSKGSGSYRDENGRIKLVADSNAMYDPTTGDIILSQDSPLLAENGGPMDNYYPIANGKVKMPRSVHLSEQERMEVRSWKEMRSSMFQRAQQQKASFVVEPGVYVRDETGRYVLKPSPGAPTNPTPSEEAGQSWNTGADTDMKALSLMVGVGPGLVERNLPLAEPRREPQEMSSGSMVPSSEPWTAGRALRMGGDVITKASTYNGQIQDVANIVGQKHFLTEAFALPYFRVDAAGGLHGGSGAGIGKVAEHIGKNFDHAAAAVDKGIAHGTAAGKIFDNAAKAVHHSSAVGHHLPAVTVGCGIGIVAGAVQSAVAGANIVAHWDDDTAEGVCIKQRSGVTMAISMTKIGLSIGHFTGVGIPFVLAGQLALSIAGFVNDFVTSCTETGWHIKSFVEMRDEVIEKAQSWGDWFYGWGEWFGFVSLLEENNYYRGRSKALAGVNASSSLAEWVQAEMSDYNAAVMLSAATDVIVAVKEQPEKIWDRMTGGQYTSAFEFRNEEGRIESWDKSRILELVQRQGLVLMKSLVEQGPEAYDSVALESEESVADDILDVGAKYGSLAGY
eukprot:TRINITY_DN13517_c0_g1_i1.p1 TRINITY_DN13517_c0_g1~~TRINITY_DN13517_c0_g1_i1.p1  ORF type:complete len:706 (+),score=127.62 TRINITY_DN13517_c0_g1_i1:1136-3253(+)